MVVNKKKFTNRHERAIHYWRKSRRILNTNYLYGKQMYYRGEIVRILKSYKHYNGDTWFLVETFDKHIIGVSSKLLSEFKDCKYIYYDYD